MSSTDFPIVDSHIHLYPEAELETFKWYTPDNPLGKRHSLAEYRAATGSPSNLKGFVFLETDRLNDEGRDWKLPLMEVEWLARIVDGKPRDGEGHTPEDAPLCLGIVPWAPMNLGAAKVEEYLEQAEKVAGPATWAKVKGFRYLLQDKPAASGLTEEFVESMRLLGKKGFIFDAGVDQHRRGRQQLDELVSMIDQAHDGIANEDDKVKFIINHFCKPNLEIINPADPSFIAWRAAMFTLGKCDRVYMKLSGMFSEMPESLRQRSVEEIFEAVQPWLAVVLAAFGPSRLMFASDWPVCTVGVDEEDAGGAWKKWKAVIDRLCRLASLSEEDQKMIWSGTAVKAYGIDI
ncbi:amidohydrolase family protein [Pyricularia oryzae]|uniref:Amidohydrolase family protein n=2 Tax=Pyricularia oryzae TaxID=318829 RepID=A0AA97NVQ5_PYRO3|nr:amidohydrolase family protein [Pyricularia oryzae Y34]KAI7924663.1 amidohydrolase family protein [Pyricularia oryzae]KAI7925198.1 amidohydrolase family protein [Pyricularia oryzae]